MSRGPYLGHKPLYELSFSDPEGAFTQGVHILRELSAGEALAKGLDEKAANLELLCALPKEGSGRIRHGMSAPVNPSFRGREGIVTIQGRADTRYLAQTRAEGLRLYGIFTELASSVDDGADWQDFSRVRRVQTGIQPDTRAPIYDTPSETVRLKLVRSSGDETSDTGSTSAVVIALAGKLAVGDVLIGPDTYVVTGTPLRKGDYEQADVSLRDY